MSGSTALGEPQAKRVLEPIATAVGLGESAASAEEIAWGTRRLLEALAGTRPLVFVVDDLHWAEPLFLDLLEALATHSEGAPILRNVPSAERARRLLGAKGLGVGLQAPP